MSVTLSEAKGLVVPGQCWFISNEILRLAPQNDNLKKCRLTS